jgi:hypothetical protein
MDRMDELRKQIAEFMEEFHLTCGDYNIGSGMDLSTFTRFMRNTYESKFSDKTFKKVAQHFERKQRQYK